MQRPDWGREELLDEDGLVELSEPHYYGEPSPEERELLAGFGNVHFHRPLISLEEPIAQT